MKHKQTKPWKLAAVVILLVSVGWFGHMRAADQFCGPLGGDHAIAWLVCNWEHTNQRVDVLEARMAKLEANQLTRAEVGGIAWDKASDRVSLFQQQSTAYTDTWFYNELYNRFRVHVCRSGVPHNERINCVGVTP